MSTFFSSISREGSSRSNPISSSFEKSKSTSPTGSNFSSLSETSKSGSNSNATSSSVVSNKSTSPAGSRISSLSETSNSESNSKSTSVVSSEAYTSKSSSTAILSSSEEESKSKTKSSSDPSSETASLVPRSRFCIAAIPNPPAKPTVAPESSLAAVSAGSAKTPIDSGASDKSKLKSAFVESASFVSGKSRIGGVSIPEDSISSSFFSTPTAVETGELLTEPI